MYEGSGSGPKSGRGRGQELGEEHAKAFSDYFQMSSGQGCPVINIPGFTYEVEEFHLEGIVQTLGVDSFAKRNSRETLIDPDVFRQIQGQSRARGKKDRFQEQAEPAR